MKGKRKQSIGMKYKFQKRWDGNRKVRPSWNGCRKGFWRRPLPSTALPLQFGLSQLFASAPICNPAFLHPYTLPTFTFLYMLFNRWSNSSLVVNNLRLLAWLMCLFVLSIWVLLCLLVFSWVYMRQFLSICVNLSSFAHFCSHGLSSSLVSHGRAKPTSSEALFDQYLNGLK